MEVTVKTNPYAKQENGKLGVANVIFGECFKARSMNINKGKDNEPFVSMPSYPTRKVDENERTVFQDYCHPITKEFREQLNQQILNTYQQAKDIAMDGVDEKVQQTEKDAVKEPKEKTSIRGKIKEGQEKAAENAVKKPETKVKQTPER